MPAGELEINGYDAYTEWGVSLEDGALSELMTPPSVKDYIVNESRLEHGTRYFDPAPMFNQRELTLAIHMSAPNSTEFLIRHTNFSDMLARGVVNIRTSRQMTTCYRCRYVSCSQFSQFHLGLAKFTLKLVEPNPYDRLHDGSPIGTNT